jgi:radical SAM-linked protein
MRLRITFAKQGALRYTGHLDLYKIWERTTRRAELPLAYSQGFHPHPQIQLAAALPLGFSSRCELVDVRLNDDVDPSTLPEKLQSAVPAGLRILKVERVDEKSPALQTLVVSAEYEVTLLDPIDETELGRRLSIVLDAETLPRERRGKAYDLRPLIEVLRILPDHRPSSQTEGGNSHLFMRLAAREAATGRPEEVLDALTIPLEGTRIERTRLIFTE